MARRPKKFARAGEPEADGERARLITIVAILAASLVITFLVHQVRVDSFLIDRNYDETDAAVILSSFAIGELFAILWANLNPEFRKLPNDVQALASSFHNLHDIEYLIHELQISQEKYVGKPAHIAAVTSLNTFLKAVELKNDRISIEGDYSARELYEEFWNQIIKEQRRLHAAKSAQGIRVFLTHSASIRLWETHQFREIRKRQKEFALQGGEIYRILIRKTSSQDSDPVDMYEKVLRDMRNTRNIYAYYLPVGEEVDHRDYFFCEFGGQFYTFVWTLDKEAAGVRGITKTEISVLSHHFKREYRDAWDDVMEALENWNPDEDMGDVLSKKPERDILPIMKELG